MAAVLKNNNWYWGDASNPDNLIVRSQLEPDFTDQWSPQRGAGDWTTIGQLKSQGGWSNWTMKPFGGDYGLFRGPDGNLYQYASKAEKQGAFSNLGTFMDSVAPAIAFSALNAGVGSVAAGGSAGLDTAAYGGAGDVATTAGGVYSAPSTLGAGSAIGGVRTAGTVAQAGGNPVQGIENIIENIKNNPQTALATAGVSTGLGSLFSGAAPTTGMDVPQAAKLQGTNMGDEFDVDSFMNSLGDGSSFNSGSNFAGISSGSAVEPFSGSFDTSFDAGGMPTYTSPFNDTLSFDEGGMPVYNSSGSNGSFWSGIENSFGNLLTSAGGGLQKILQNPGAVLSGIKGGDLLKGLTSLWGSRQNQNATSNLYNAANQQLLNPAQIQQMLNAQNQNAISDTERALGAQGYNFSGNMPMEIAQRLQGNNLAAFWNLMKNNTGATANLSEILKQQNQAQNATTAAVGATTQGAANMLGLV